MINCIQNTKIQQNNFLRSPKVSKANSLDFCSKDYSSQNNAVQMAKSNYGRALVSFRGNVHEQLIGQVKKLHPLYQEQLSEALLSPDFFLTKPLAKTMDGLDKLGAHICANAKNPREYLQGVASNSQVLMLGEEHSCLPSKAFATGMLADLKKQGYGYAAVELDKKYQVAVDGFLSGEISEKALSDKDNSFFVDGTGIIDKSCSMDFLKECKKQGMKVVCMDDTEEYFKNVIKFFNDPETLNNNMYSRDGKIFKNIEEHIFDKDKDAKVLIYVGAMHTMKDKIGNDSYLSLRMLLDKKLGDGKTSSVSVTTANNANVFAEIPNIPSNVAFSTQNKAFDGMIYGEPFERFMFEPGYVYYDKHIDGMVLLPEEEKVSTGRYGHTLEN